MPCMFKMWFIKLSLTFAVLLQIMRPFIIQILSGNLLFGLVVQYKDFSITSFPDSQVWEGDWLAGFHVIQLIYIIIMP